MIGKGWWVKLVVLVGFLITAILFTVPTVLNLNPETSKFPVTRKINLGLDLQGGLYMVLGVDFDKFFKNVVERQGSVLEQALKAKNITVTATKVIRDGYPADDSRFLIDFPDASKADVRTLLADYGTFRVTAEKPGQFELGLTAQYRNEARERTLNQSIEVIRNRIDEFGVSEPSITSQGMDRVVVELPGVKDVERAKELIGRTARLEFRLVDDKSLEPGKLAQLISQIETEKKITFKDGQRFSDYVGLINEGAKGKIPEGREIAFERPKGLGGEVQADQRIPYLLFSKAEVTGDDLQDASVGMDQEKNRPNVNFSFNPRGASLFSTLTGSHIQSRLAIVLDNIVHSAPVIQGAIGANGQISLGTGNYETVLKEATDLAIVLRAGALPAQLEFQEQRVIGPSLGQDSIRKGANAGIIGCMLIFVFMIFYYRLSGVVAVISLALNAIFLFAILVGMEATLTLPGMAGIALTIGMAVDSNVIIFERIRDELREGKTVSAAIQAGFDKAFTAIFDANITHGIIAGILMAFGTGPIRGFAVALMIGIVTTLFCAITVCKLFFDGYIGFARREPTRLSI